MDRYRIWSERYRAAGRNVSASFGIGDILSPEWPPVHQRNACDWVIGMVARKPIAEYS